MTEPTTPGQEGPTFGPPSLPQGWIAQWDGTSKKYYFVQLSTGASQWETPTQAAPTVGTPTPTPGQETSPFPQPGHQQEGEDGERGLSSIAMNQLLHSQLGGHSGKPANPLLGMAGQLLAGGSHNQTQQQTSNPLLGMAGQLLSGGSHTQAQQTSSAGAAGIVGALAGSLLGGNTKPNQGPQQVYSGQSTQGAYGQNQDGFAGKIGAMFGGTGSGHQNTFGYSENGQHQGGYTGQAPSSSYQPTGSSYQVISSSGTQGYSGQSPVSSYQLAGSQSAQGPGAYYSPQQSSYNQNSQQQSYPTNSQIGSNSRPNQFYGSQQSQQQPMYGIPQHPLQSQSAYGISPQQQQQQYGMPPQQQQQQQQQQQYGITSQQQQQPYGAPPQPQQQQQQQQPYGTSQQQEPYPSPIYIGSSSDSLPQSQHQMFSGFHNPSHQGGSYGDPGAPPQIPMGSHPNHSQGYPPPPPRQGGPHEMPTYGRGGW